MCKVTGSDQYYVNLIPMNQEPIKSYYTINGLCLFIVCVILTPDHPQVRYTNTMRQLTPVCMCSFAMLLRLYTVAMETKLMMSLYYYDIKQMIVDYLL